MTRLGWIVLVMILAAGATFGLMLAAGNEESADASSKQIISSKIGDATGSLVIPVEGVKPTQLTDSWGDSRSGGARRHSAIDIMAPRGTLVKAAAPGRIEKLFDSANGGRTIYVRSDDRRTVHYYAHLDSYRAGLREGQRVRTGEVIGTVGSTGSASAEAPHLHFEIKRMAADEPWHRGNEVNPYPLLAGNAARR